MNRVDAKVDPRSPVGPTPGDFDYAGVAMSPAVMLPDGEVWTMLRPARYQDAVHGRAKERTAANARLMASAWKLARALDAALALIHEYEPGSSSYGALEARAALSAAFEDPDSALR